MNIFKETFEKSSLSRKSVVTESKKVTESVNEEAKAEIADIVAMEFESGHITFNNFEDFKRNSDMLDTSKEAWEYYLELRNLGPVGFYEVYKDVFDFSPDFVAEYGSDEVSENEYEDESEDIVEPKRNINVELARKYCSTGPTCIFNYMITVKKNEVEDIRYIQCFCKEQAEEYLRRTEPDLEIIDFENVGSYTLTMQGIHPVDLVSVKESEDASIDRMQESTNARWVQVDLNAEDDYKYSGNGGRSWVTKDSEHVDTWSTKEDAIENGMKTFRKGRKLGRDWDVVCLESKLLEDDSKLTADSLKWEERSERRRVAQFKLRGCDVEIEEHNATDGLHYYLYVEDTDLDDILCNGREFGSAESALQHVYEITAAPEPEEMKENFDINEGNAATFEDTLEKEIKEAGRNFMLLPRIGFEENEIDDYFNVNVVTTEEYVKVSVGAELSYRSLEDLCTELTNVINKHDKDAYFEPECPGRAVAYLFDYRG